MKTCKDCLHYEACKKNENLYHTSRLTPESDVTDSCEYFADKTLKNITFCKDCKHLMFSDCYAEGELAYKGIVNIDNFCDRGELK